MGKLATKLLCIIVLALGTAACSDDDSGSGPDDPSQTGEALTGAAVKLSVMAPESGIVAQPEIFDGALTAVAAINDAGGIADPDGGDARPLEIVECRMEGTTTDPQAPLKCAEDAIEAGVVADVGKYLFATEGVKAFQQAGVPLIGTVPIEQEDFINPNVFAFNGGAPVLIAGTGAALQEAGAKTIGVLTGDVPAGRALPGFVKPVLGSPEDLTTESYVPLDASADLTPFAAKVAQENPDGMVMAASGDINVKAILALRQAGYQGLIGVPASNLSAETIDTLGDAAEGIISAGTYEAVTDEDNETIAQFNKEMDDYAPDAQRNEFSLNAWLAVHYTADLLADADKLDAATLLAAVQAKPTVDLGATPEFTLGEPNNFLQLPTVPAADVQFKKVEGGEVVAIGDFVDLNEMAG
jgi:ABC-type branched-subunit amino acid transport system substrate-binding protein